MGHFDTLVFFTMFNPDFLKNYPRAGVNLYLPLWQKEELATMFKTCYPAVDTRKLRIISYIWGCDISRILPLLNDDDFNGLAEMQNMINHLRRKKARYHLAQAFSKQSAAVRINSLDYLTYEATWASDLCLDHATLMSDHKEWWDYRVTGKGWKHAGMEDLKCEVLKVKLKQQLNLSRCFKAYSLQTTQVFNVVRRAMEEQEIELRKVERLSGAGWFIYCTTPTLKISFERWFKYAQERDRIYYVLPMEYLSNFELILTDKNGLEVKKRNPLIEEFIVPLTKSHGGSCFDRAFMLA